MESSKEKISQESANIADDIKLLMSNPDQDWKVQESVNLDHWMRFIAEYLDTERNPVDEPLIKKLLDDLGRVEKLKADFPENCSICAAIIPCNRQGEEFADYDRDNGEYVKMLVLAPPEMEKENRVYHIYRLVYNLLPPEIRDNCTFSVGRYTEKPDPPYDIGKNERTALFAKYAKALANLKYLCDKYFKGR
jgi:hypothetical protein